MNTLPAYLLVTLKCDDYISEVSFLVAPCNLYQAIGKLMHDPTYANSKKWSITIQPSDIEYFEGE